MVPFVFILFGYSVCKLFWCSIKGLLLRMDGSGHVGFRLIINVFDMRSKKWIFACIATGIPASIPVFNQKERVR